MRRVLGAFTVICLLMAPTMASAGEKTGIYIAPKFSAGWAVMDNMKTGWGDDADPGINMNIGDKTKSAIGGALAIGYDFDRQFNVPIRTEIEYAAFSRTKGKKSGNISGADDGDGGSFDGHWSSKQSIQVQTLFLNAYYDIETGTSFTPYVGGGIGMAFLDTKGSFSGDDYTNNRSAPVIGVLVVYNLAAAHLE